MQHNIEYKHFSPNASLRQLIDASITRLERYAPALAADATFLRLFIEQNEARTLFRVSLTAAVPGRTLAAHEERHDPEEAVRAAFDDMERQLVRHKEAITASDSYKRPARREELRRKKGKVAPGVPP
jgi:ribosomal subunit interface protein